MSTGTQWHQRPPRYVDVHPTVLPTIQRLRRQLTATRRIVTVLTTSFSNLQHERRYGRYFEVDPDNNSAIL